MKKKWMLLVVTVFAALIVVGIAIQNMPMVMVSTFSILSLIALLVFVAAISIFVLVRKQKSLLIKLEAENIETGDNKDLIKRSNHIKAWTLLIVLAVIVGGFLIYQQNKSFVTNAHYLEKRIAQLSGFIESIEEKDQGCLLSNLLDKIDDELENNPERILTSETIARIAELSKFFEPDSYSYVEKDSLPESDLSRLRGQLLVTLINMKIDTGTLDKIIYRTSFSRADLREADLRGAYLKRIDLRGAYLKDAKLQGVKLNEADLRGAYLWGTDLSNSDLTEANLIRANLSWADFSGADLKKADLSGANLNATLMRRADLSRSVMQWADLSGVILDEANLEGADLLRTNLERAHLSNANLSNANLRITNLSEANLAGAALVGTNLYGTKLIGADLTGANLVGAKLNAGVVSEENWLDRLDEWMVKGAKEIQSTYRIVDANSTGQSYYKLKKIND
jgi:uncharacterized protein YjbI with pentapeptide repeats